MKKIQKERKPLPTKKIERKKGKKYSVEKKGPEVKKKRRNNGRMGGDCRVKLAF